MRTAEALACNGFVVLFLGLIGGAPYGAAIVGGWSAEAIAAWKLAHMEGVQNGILLLVLAGTFGLLSLGRRAEQTFFWGAVLAAYGNALGAILGALSGERGLAPEGPLLNWFVFFAFMFGMWGVLIAVPIGAIGAWRTIRSTESRG